MHGYLKISNISSHIVSDTSFFVSKILVLGISIVCPCRIHVVSGYHRSEDEEVKEWTWVLKEGLLLLPGNFCSGQRYAGSLSLPRHWRTKVKTARVRLNCEKWQEGGEGQKGAQRPIMGGRERYPPRAHAGGVIKSASPLENESKEKMRVRTRILHRSRGNETGQNISTPQILKRLPNMLLMYL